MRVVGNEGMNPQYKHVKLYSFISILRASQISTDSKHLELQSPMSKENMFHFLINGIHKRKKQEIDGTKRTVSSYQKQATETAIKNTIRNQCHLRNLGSVVASNLFPGHSFRPGRGAPVSATALGRSSKQVRPVPKNIKSSWQSSSNSDYYNQWKNYVYCMLRKNTL